jgi:hypothetical protein
LITVVGCGGDRDKTKRPLMAAVACNLSNQVILTSDNPRSENPDTIIEDMMQELDPVQKKKVLVIIDRKQAIKTACRLAKTNDIILVAGKGHEKYQEINGEKTVLNGGGLREKYGFMDLYVGGLYINKSSSDADKIILADEPTGNLDSANSESMMDLLFNYTKKSKTSLVMVTHDNSIAERCDRIIEIKDGQIV